MLFNGKDRVNSDLRWYGKMPISDGYGEMIIGNFPFWRNGIFRWKCLSLILWADMTMVNTIHKLTDVTAYIALTNPILTLEHPANTDSCNPPFHYGHIRSLFFWLTNNALIQIPPRSIHWTLDTSPFHPSNTRCFQFLTTQLSPL